MKDINVTHDSNLTIPSRPAFLSVLAALNASVISFFVLWSNVDAEVINHAEEHGFDSNQLLSYTTSSWSAARASLLSLLALGVLAFLAWRRSRLQSE